MTLRRNEVKFCYTLIKVFDTKVNDGFSAFRSLIIIII